MRFYKDQANQIHSVADDGSQEHRVQKGWKLISKEQANVIIDQNQQKLFDDQDYYRKRVYSYPPVGDFIDAFIKGDEQAIEEYSQKCIEVKNMYPKPEGF